MVRDASALGRSAPYALRTAARAPMRLLRICWRSGLFRRARSMAWSMVKAVAAVESRGATCADACVAAATRLMRISDRIIVEEVGFSKTYGQLYNRVSAPNTPSFLKIELRSYAGARSFTRQH